MSATNNGNNQSVKNSKSLYALAIYGFIALFVIIVFPFLPFYEDGSLFESGLKKFNEGVYGNLIATISMLCHSIILLIVGLIMISKFKKYKAGAGYSFFNLFKVTILLCALVLIGFDVSNYFYVIQTSYGIEYWYIVLGVYGVGLLFALFAQICNPELRASKAKVLYNLLSWLAILGLFALVFTKGQSVSNRYFTVIKDEFEQTKVVYNTETIKSVQNIYYILRHILFFSSVCYTVNICMPLNQPFSYMNAYYRKKSKYSPLSTQKGVFAIFGVVVLFIVFLVAGGKEELITVFLLGTFALGRAVGAYLYNKRVSSKMYVPPVIPTTFKGFYHDKRKNENLTTTTTTVIKSSPTNTQQTQKVVVNVKPWEVSALENVNRYLDFKDKTSVDKICDDLYLMINDHGFDMEKTDVQKILAGILSAKVTFVRTSADDDTIRTLADILSDFFGEELFFERRERIEDLEEVAVTENKEQDEVNVSADVNGTEESAVTIESVETSIKREKTAEQVAHEKKYGIAGALFASHYLFNTFGMAFVDGAELDSISEFDEELITALTENEEEIYVGRNEYIPEDEVFSYGVMKIPANFRLVMFISEGKNIKLQPNWIKYSTIVDVELKQNPDAKNELQLNSGTSYTMINQSLEEAHETCYLTEDYWRKIDRLEEYLAEHTAIRFDNRFIRQVEDNIASFMCCGMTKVQALDAVLSEKIIPLIATEREKILDAHEADFAFKLDELFGFENIPFSKQALSVYGLKKITTI